MKVNGIGILNESGEFQFHQSIFESFSIFDDTILFGMFYPKEYDDPKSKELKPYPIDFVFTPIPFDVWGKTARLIIRVKVDKQNDALESVTNKLKESNVTILNSILNRSSHSYSTLDLYIAFENNDFSAIFDGLEVSETKINPKDKIKFEISDSKTIIVEAKKIAQKLLNTSKSKEECIERFNEIFGNSFNEKQRYFYGTYYKKEVLLQDIVNDEDFMKNFVFINDELNREQGVRCEVNTGLHFFYFEAQKRISEKINKINNLLNTSTKSIERTNIEHLYDTLYRPFTLRYSNGFVRQDGIDKQSGMGNIKTSSHGKLSNILYGYLKYFHQESNKFTELEENLPALTFLEGDSHFLCFRAAVIPKSDSKRFLKLNFFYQRMNMPYSSKGLLNFVTKNIQPHYKIWRFHNRLFDCRETYGSGKMSFFLEDIRKNKNYGIELERLSAESEFIQISDKAKETDFKDFTFKIKIESAQNIMNKHFQSLNGDSFKNEFDVFISHSSKDKAEAEHISEVLESRGLTSYLSSKEISGGDIFSDKIRSSLVNSRELCILYSPNSQHSSWVITEWGAAWALKKRITPVLLDITAKSIPDDHERLKRLHYIRYREEELKEYAKKIQERRFFSNDNDNLT